MPLVSGNSVEIDFVGRADSVIAASNDAMKALDATKAKVQSNAAALEAAAKKEQAALQKTAEKYKGSLIPGVQKAGEAVGNFVSKNSVLIGALAATGAAAVKSYQSFQKYAGSVRDLALASGTGAEEASLLLQVLDDYEISAENVTAATKAMTKEGLTPSLDTLMQLSDEYVAIQDPMQKNEFLLKNLGKAGLDWAHVLDQGSAALQDASEEVNKNLILTDEQIQKAEMARLAVDAWGDAWEGFKVSIGGAIGEIIAVNAELGDQVKQYEELTGTTLNFSRAQGEATKNFEAFQAQMKRGKATTEFYRKQLGSLPGDLEDIEDAQDSLFESSDTFMSVLKSVSSETEEYNEKNQELLDKLKDLTDEQANTSEWSNKYRELNGEIEATKSEIESLAAEHEKASQQIIFGLISQQAAATGFKDISVQALAQLGEQWGVLAEGSAEATSAAISNAEAWTEALSEASQKLTDINGKVKALQRLAETGIVITAEIAYSVSGGAMGGANVMTQCFTGDTLILMSDGSSKFIKDVEIGDTVTSYDIDKGATIQAKVTETFEHPKEEVSYLLLLNQSIRVTPEHLLWDGFAWKAAGSFVVGDLLMTPSGSHIRLESTYELRETETVYNIHTDKETHNYFANGILAHNAKESGLWAGGDLGKGVKSLAGGGSAGAEWALVGDRQGGGFVPGVSELMFGNAHVFDSKTSEKILKSGVLGKINSFAFGSDDPYPNSGGGVSIPYVPSGGGTGGKANSPSEGGSYSSMVQQFESDQQATQNEVANLSTAVQMQAQQTAQLLNMTTQSNQHLSELVALAKRNPLAVGKSVAYEVAKKT